MKLGEFGAYAISQIRKCGFPEPALESLYLLSFVLNKPMTTVMADEGAELTEDEEESLNALLGRRLKGEPMAYVLGFKDFYKSRFIVRPGVLIPRPETEHLVEEAVQLCGGKFKGRILDIGCGSGCIGLSLLKEWPEATLVCVDKEAIPVQVTKENASALGVEKRVEILHGDLTDLVIRGSFDLIVANPPYIDVRDPATEENVRKFEPSAALFAEKDGYELIFKWLAYCGMALKPKSYVLMEIGAGQSKKIADIFPQDFPQLEELKFVKDYAGHDRVLVARSK